MIKSRLCDLIGIKYPIIQAGMGPFSNNNLCVATANAGVLGLLSTSGVFDKDAQPWIYDDFVRTGEADPDDDMATVLEKVLKRTYRLVKDKGGIFGPNVMVSKEILPAAQTMIDTAIRVREENPDMKKHLKVMYTSAGDPLGWEDKIKGAGFTWIHIVPSVRAAIRSKKAGVDVIVASGHEGGFHTSWEPVHSMVLGTRFLATQESDFHPMWKQEVVDAGDRATLVARGFVGPARWLKTPRSQEHAKHTLQKSPGVFLGIPEDYSTADEVTKFEIESMKATFEGNKEKAMMAAGEAAQRIKDMPRVNDLVQGIMRETEIVLREAPKKILA